MRESFDIIVVGAGPAGLAAALGFAAAGARTALVDQGDPTAAAATDLRTTALLQPSIAFLERLGVWARVAPSTAPLATLRIVDIADSGARRERDFTADALESGAFGRNVANAALKGALLASADASDAVELIAPATVLAATRREDAAIVTLDVGGAVWSLTAQLVVAADGRGSQMRAAAGVAARRMDHGLRATVCVLRHPEPHHGLSAEMYSQGGPFTLVPFVDDADGSPRSSLVWMKRNADAAALEALDDAGFAAAATAQSDHLFGPLALASSRMSWPVETLIAERFVARRLALMGEAAHATPPVGAQGLNMSMADAAQLADHVATAREQGADLGDRALLAGYDKTRRQDVAARVGAVAALTVAADGRARPLRQARFAGLAAAHGLKPVRERLIRAGLGAAG